MSIFVYMIIIYDNYIYYFIAIFTFEIFLQHFPSHNPQIWKIHFKYKSPLLYKNLCEDLNKILH